MAFGKRFSELLGVELPIIQAPMAGSSDAELAIAVSEAGGLGSLPCAMLSADQVRSSYQTIQQRTARPVNVNFFATGFHPRPTSASVDGVNCCPDIIQREASIPPH